jgi:hypothetical protein
MMINNMKCIKLLRNKKVMNLLPRWFKGYLYVLLEPYRFERRKGLKSSLLLVVLMKNKHLLHIINEITSMMGSLRDLLYIYKYREIITSGRNDSYNRFRSKIY